MATLKFILRPGSNVKKVSAKGKKKASIRVPVTREVPIYLQYVHEGDKILIGTGLKCTPKGWDKDKGRPRKDTKLEDRLDTLKRRFRDNAVFKLTNPIAPAVRDKWSEFLEEEKQSLPESTFRGSILYRWSEYLKYLGETLYKGKPRTRATIQNNTNSREHFKAFLAKKVELKPERFTITDFQRFEAYLVKNIAPNTIAKIKKHFKSFLQWHVRTGGRIGFDISLIEYSETEGVKIALSEEQLTKIAHEDFGETLNLSRDLMILQASTGVRISDLQRLCDHLTDDKTAFKIRTKKTGGSVMVPVLPLARLVLKRREFKFPRIAEQDYRAGIKAIYKALWPSKMIEVGRGDGIKKVHVWEEISSHDMVRTFVTISAQKGISVPTIATIVGKSVQVLIRHYLTEDKEHAAKELLEKFDVSPLKIAQ